MLMDVAPAPSGVLPAATTGRGYVSVPRAGNSRCLSQGSKMDATLQIRSWMPTKRNGKMDRDRPVSFCLLMVQEGVARTGDVLGVVVQLRSPD